MTLFGQRVVVSSRIESKNGKLKAILARRAAMAAAVWGGLQIAPDFTQTGWSSRIVWLIGLVVLGIAVYAAAMLAMGFRPRELHAMRRNGLGAG